MQQFSNISTGSVLRVIFFVQMVLTSLCASSQTCSDPVNVIYGITNAGTIHAINVNTGIVGAAINPAYTGNAPDQSNGLAYNSVNGKFYYFKRIPSSTITEFVSFDPATNTYTTLANPATTNAVYSGSITNDGTGYYCWDTQGRLFYYNISANTWPTITSNIKDQYGNDVDSIIRLHYSGDGAIDGNGNLWILPSGNSKYGLFRLNAPLPTTPVASITVEQVIPMTATSSTFVGIAFNSTGQIFMSTSSGNLYRLENNLSLTLMSTLTTSMADLTSCNFPMAILAGADYYFTAFLTNGNVKLAWQSSHEPGTVTYILERSVDNRNWTTIARESDLRSSGNKISFTDVAPLYGRNFYRIKIVDALNHISYSMVRTVAFSKESRCSVWPNPVSNYLFIHNPGEAAWINVYNESGLRVRSVRITSGLNNIDFRLLPTGRYFISIHTSDGKSSAYKIVRK